MKSPLACFARLFMAAVLLAMATVQPALAQQDQGDAGPSVLRDTETELLFKDMSRPLILAGGLDPHSVNVVLLNDPEINAFVSQGQTVYLQSGLIEAADNVNQVQGVVAHELGHVKHRDVQAGLVLVAAGIGFNLVSLRFPAPGSAGLYGVGVIMMLIGVALVLSAGAFYLLSKRFGLWQADVS